MNEADFKRAVSEVLDEKLGDFYVDRETHYKQHLFIEKLMKFCDICTGTVTKTVVTSMCTVFFLSLLIGFAIWLKTIMKT